MLADYLKELEGNSLERLRFMVLREFGVLPSSREAKKLTDRDLIICAMHMLLDLGAEENKDESFDVNSSFDEEKYFGLMESGYEENRV